MHGAAITILDDRDEPLSTRGWSVQSLTELSESMKPIPRISASVLLSQGKEELEKIVKDYEVRGEPVIVEGWHELSSWPGEKLFGIDWLAEHGEDMIEVRDCVSAKDRIISFREFVDKSRTMSPYSEKGEMERLYGKDAQCPFQWQKWLLESDLPEHIKPGGSEDMLQYLKGLEHVETLMCYHGIGDTFTPAHKDLCASNGHNLLLSSENGGSAFWFMTSSSDAPKAASFFQKKLGTELDHEARIVQPEEFAAAGFTVYVAEQKLGDLVLVPRRSCHQVVNHGGLTTKLSWSKMMLCGLETAFYHELPLYRRVCRSETYRIKLLIYRALLEYCERLEAMFVSLVGTSSTAPSSPDCDVMFPSGATPGFKQLAFDAERLVNLYDKVLREEYQGQEECKLSRSPPPSTLRHSNELKEDNVEYDSLTCDFCGVDIFQSYFECRKCRRFEGDDEVLLCPGCVVEGRHCPCMEMKPTQKYSMESLVEAQTRAAEIINKALRRSSGVKVVPLSPTLLCKTPDQHPCLFTVACYIHRMRLQAKSRGRTESQCRAISSKTKTKDSCVAPLGGTLNCKKCHASRCLKHYLDKGLHVTEACLLYVRTDDHVKLHESHVSKSNDPIEKWHQLSAAEEKGTACNMYAKLAFLAKNYSNCLPVRVDLERGWYDQQRRRKVILTLSSSPKVVRKVPLPPIAEKVNSVRRRRDDSPLGMPFLSPSPDSESEDDDERDSDYLGEGKRPSGRPRKKLDAKAKSKGGELPAAPVGKISRPQKRFSRIAIRDGYVGEKELTPKKKALYKPVPEWALEQDGTSDPPYRRLRGDITKSPSETPPRPLAEVDTESASAPRAGQQLTPQVIDVDRDRTPDDDPIDILSSYDKFVDHRLDKGTVIDVEDEVEEVVQPASSRNLPRLSDRARSGIVSSPPIVTCISDELKAELIFFRSMRDNLTRLPDLQLQYEACQERMSDQLEAGLEASDSRCKHKHDAMQERATEQEEQMRSVLERVEGIENVCQGFSEAKEKAETQLAAAKTELTEARAELEEASARMLEMLSGLNGLKDVVQRIDENVSLAIQKQNEAQPPMKIMHPPRSQHMSVQYSPAIRSANPNARLGESHAHRVDNSRESHSVGVRPPPASAGPSLSIYERSASTSTSGRDGHSGAPSTSPTSPHTETSPTIRARERKRKRNEEQEHGSRGPKPTHHHQPQGTSASASSIEGENVQFNSAITLSSSSAITSSSNQNDSLSLKIPSRAQSQDSLEIVTVHNRAKKKRARKN